MKQFWLDFKKFISRGNIIDMAIGVTVASAFTAIVTAFTKGFISPLLALITGNSSLDTMVYVIQEATEDAAAVEILWGAFLQKVIDFLIIAFVLFLVMRIASSVMARSKKIRENLINAISDRDEKAAEEAAIAAAEAKAKEEAEAKAKAEAEAAEAAKIKDEEDRRAEELALLKEIRDLLKNNRL